MAKEESWQKPQERRGSRCRLRPCQGWSTIPRATGQRQQPATPAVKVHVSSITPGGGPFLPEPTQRDEASRGLYPDPKDRDHHAGGRFGQVEAAVSLRQLLTARFV